MIPLTTERCRNSYNHTDKCEYLAGKIPVVPTVGIGTGCSCAKGKELEATLFWEKYGRKMEAKEFVRVALSPLFTSPNFSNDEEDVDLDPACERCSVILPRMLMCGRCKTAKYCSKDCQKSHWPEHKVTCSARC